MSVQIICSVPLDGIIPAMTAHSLNIELPDADRPSVWPWLVALLAGASMMLVVSQKLQSIPTSLSLSAQRIIDESGSTGISFVSDGRDLSLVGSIDINQSAADLISKISAIDGVRLVTDNLQVIDPQAEAAAHTQQFLQALANVNLSDVAFQPGNVTFASGSDIALNQLARLLTLHTNVRIRIEGHTDDTGPSAVNLRLSKERAQQVATFLSAKGVADDRLIAIGYGSTQPIDSNLTDSGRAHNRRIEISYVD